MVVLQSKVAKLDRTRCSPERAQVKAWHYDNVLTRVDPWIIGNLGSEVPRLLSIREVAHGSSPERACQHVQLGSFPSFQALRFTSMAPFKDEQILVS